MFVQYINFIQWWNHVSVNPSDLHTFFYAHKQKRTVNVTVLPRPLNHHFPFTVKSAEGICSSMQKEFLLLIFCHVFCHLTAQLGHSSYYSDFSEIFIIFQENFSFIKMDQMFKIDTFPHFLHFSWAHQLGTLRPERKCHMDTNT